MVGIREGIAVLVVATLCLTVAATGSVLAVDDSDLDDDIPVDDDIDDAVDGFEIDSETECFSGDGTAFTVGSEDDTHIWIRLHAAMLTDSGGSFGAELTGSTEEDRIIEVLVGADHVGDGILSTVTSPLKSFDLVGGFDFQLPIFDDVDTDPDIGNGQFESEFEEDDEPAEEEDPDEEETKAEEREENDGPFELIDC